jgi:phytoene dehydrogenase-like protein
MSARVVIIGAGHNGLVCAAYLARAGLEVKIVERREVLGGSCVTEELWPGFHVSRAAYVLGLFRPHIVKELDLERFGLRLLPRNPSSLTFTPAGRSLVLGADLAANVEEIRRFSTRDADAFPRYEALLEKVARAAEPLLDVAPPQPVPRSVRDLTSWLAGLRSFARLGRDLPRAAAIFLGPARDLLEEWFDSEPLRATLATDAVIGAFASPSTPGTGYVLFHHVMGSVTGHRGVWAYVAGGMGKLCDAVAGAARSAGAVVRTGCEVGEVRIRDGRAVGVTLADGEEIAADAVVSGVDPARTFFGLVGERFLPQEFARALRVLDFRSPVLKMNLALRRLPQFRVDDRDTLPPLAGTIHLGALSLDALDDAFDQARQGEVSETPMVELTIPSVVDPSLAPEGCYVASIFAQYAPSLSPDDPRWPQLREDAVERILAQVESVAPGFREDILHYELLAAPDLETVFGLTGGNIFHGAMTPDRLLFSRPLPGWTGYRTPIEGLYMCGSGTHPGGGIIGACGRTAAAEVKRDLTQQRRSLR